MSYLVGSEVALYLPSLDDSGNGTGTLTDLVNSNDGTITGATWETDTDNGGKRALEYSSDYVTVSNSGDFAFGTDPVWFSCWFKLTSTSQQMILDKGYNTGNTTRLFFILLNSTTYRIYPGDTPAALDFTASGYLNDWVNVIFQRNGVTVTAWVNGSQAAQKTNLPSGKDLTNSDNLVIGARSDATTAFFSGRVDEARFGTGVLTAQQIAKLSSRRVPATPLAQMLHHHSVAGYQ